MELRHLRLVHAVAKLKSLTRASEILFLSQSALSHQLREFEEELGFKLFHRNKRELEITELGKVVLKQAEKVLDNLNDLNLELSEIKGDKRGLIRFSMQAYTSFFWFPDVVQRFQHKYPNVEIEIVSDHSSEPLKLLSKNELDMALVVLKEDNPEIRFERLIEDELVFVVHAESSFAQKDYVDLEEIQNITLFTHGTRKDLDKVLENTNHSRTPHFNKVINIRDTFSILEMIDLGLGAAILSKWAIQYYSFDNTRFIKIGPEGTPKYWYLSELRNRKESEYETKFKEILRSTLKALN